MVINRLTKVLVIAPHADDEAFGCGGTISKMTDQGAQVHLVIGALGRPHKPNLEEYNTRIRELAEARNNLGIQKVSVLCKGSDSHLDTIPIANLVYELDTILEEDRPNYVFFPYPSHHQDHRVIQRATIAALRPGAHKTPSHILMYEYTYPSWSNDDTPKGRYYVEIPVKHMDSKIAAIYAYESQLRQFPHPVSVEAAMALARVRGMAINVGYAEMFYVVQIAGEI